MRYLALAVGLSGCVIGGGEAEWAFDEATALSASFANGEIRVESWDADDALVQWDGGGIGEVARPEVWQGGNGCVFVDADGGLGGGELRARVPAGAPVTVLLDAGEIDVTLAAPADVDVCVGAGEVTITVPPGRYALDLDLAAGHLATGIVDDPDAEHFLRVCAGAGEVTVRASE